MLARYDGAWPVELGGQESWTVRSHTIDTVVWPGRDLFNATFDRHTFAALGYTLPSAGLVIGQTYEIKG